MTSKKVLSFGMKHRNATASTLEFEILHYTLKIYSSNHNQPFNDFFSPLFQSTGRTECVCDEQEGFVFWNETQKCYRVYTQGPCPDNAWLIPADDLTEVFCECQAGYHFSPSQYACRRTPMVKSPLGSNPGLHLLLKNHKMYPTLSTSSDDYDEVN